ncbi:Rhodanese-like domain [Carpediemonas membranifera]|uniref:Rhodanese-like domain n=1 Tax=Carpediemonas membranifera TaxID=201153 RepID=A0A8J6EB12_9EUKA|nr:Rhodanese-like domain [Carpediemonas membranifera]|eukprot:KAG9395935.1 Rhodanese-like domain [Carpediemonas membranifera]
MNKTNFLVDPKWVSEHNDVVILEASWVLDRSKTPTELFEEEHVPNASCIDLFFVNDDSELRDVFPPRCDFCDKMNRLNLGLDGTEDVVVYDRTGVASSASRLFSCLHHFGHRGNVYILNGGMPAWKAAGLPTAPGPAAVRPSKTYVCGPHTTDIYVDTIDVKNRGETQLIDVRFEKLWKAGRIPGSLNKAGSSLLDENKCFLPADQLKAGLEGAGVDVSKDLIAYCGYGVVSSLIYPISLLLKEAGETVGKWQVYDKSIVGWKAEGNAVDSDAE